MSTTLEPEIVQRLDQKAHWYVDCDFRDRSDTTVFPGDGVDDLDSLLRLIDNHPKLRMVMDIGQTNSVYRPVTRDDIVALRVAYVAAWGETPRPPVWNDTHGQPHA